MITIGFHRMAKPLTAPLESINMDILFFQLLKRRVFSTVPEHLVSCSSSKSMSRFYVNILLRRILCFVLPLRPLMFDEIIFMRKEGFGVGGSCLLASEFDQN
jgi:hypothetical protein